MVKINRTQPAPTSLAAEKKNGTLNYRGKDVVSQLNKDFHGKCYLCEINELQSTQIEHLKPHHGKDLDLIYVCFHLQKDGYRQDRIQAVQLLSAQTERYCPPNVANGAFKAESSSPSSRTPAVPPNATSKES